MKHVPRDILRRTVMAGLVASLVLGSVAARAEAVRPGQAAPRMALRDLDGRVFALSDLAYPGPERPRRPRSAVLLDFFRTDCAPCRSKLPELVRRYPALAAQGITVVLVALLEPDEGETKLRTFLAANPVPFPVVVDRYEDVARRFIFEGDSAVLPSMVVVDGEGRVQAVGRDLGEPVAAALERVGRKTAQQETP